MPRRHLFLSVTLTTALLAVTSALGQERASLQALAEKVCQLGKTAEKNLLFEQMGLSAPLLAVIEPALSDVVVSASTCSSLLPRAGIPYLGMRHLMEATAPKESAFMDYFAISGSGELITAFRHNLTVNALIRLDITEPTWREEVRDLESYWLNKYGLKSR